MSKIMRRIPTNIALSEGVQRRLRVVAASMGKRPCEIAELAILEALPQLELQVLADAKADPLRRKRDRK